MIVNAKQYEELRHEVLRLAAPASEAMTRQVVAIDGSLGLAGLLLTLRMVKRNGDDRTSTHLVYGPAVQARQPIEGMAGPGAKRTITKHGRPAVR